MSHASRPVLCLALLAAAACGGGSGGSGNPPPPADATTVVGVAYDLATGARLAGVKVTSGDHTATTGAGGEFTLTGLPAGKVVLGLEKAGYAPAYATPQVGSAADPALIALKPEGTPHPYDPATAATLVQRTEAGPYAVTFAPGSLDTVDPSLTVTVTPVDPTREPNALPGSLRTAGAAGAPLLPVTFAEFTIRDSAGRKVQLKPSATATVELPIPPSLRATYPLGAKIHCYAFSPTTGGWDDFVEGTVVTSSVDQATPVLAAAIRHFSWYGAAPEGQVCTQIHGTVVSQVDGRPLRNAHVEAFPGGDAYSEDGGDFMVIAPQDTQVTFTATKRGIDGDGSITGMPGAYYIEFGKVSQWVGLGNVSCTTGEPLPAPPRPAIASPRALAAADTVALRTAPLTRLYHQVNGIFSAPTAVQPDGAAVVAIQNGVLDDAGQLVDPQPTSGAAVTVTGPAGAVTFGELLQGSGLYGPAAGSGFQLAPGTTYQVDVDVDGNGSVDGTGSIQVVGQVAFATPADGSAHDASGFTMSWTDAASGGEGYAPLYEVLVTAGDGSAAALYVGTERSFVPYDLSQGPGHALPPGSYQAQLFAIGGFTPAPDASYQPTANFGGVGVGGWLFSWGETQEVGFTLQ